jgi:hypothetical protein
LIINKWLKIEKVSLLIYLLLLNYNYSKLEFLISWFRFIIFTNLNMKYRSFCFLFLLLSTFAVTEQQSNTCYVNCKEGYCSPTNAQLCTGCDAGLININGVCVAGSNQPVNYHLFRCQLHTGNRNLQMFYLILITH